MEFNGEICEKYFSILVHWLLRLYAERNIKDNRFGGWDCWEWSSHLQCGIQVGSNPTSSTKGFLVLIGSTQDCGSCSSGSNPEIPSKFSWKKWGCSLTEKYPPPKRDESTGLLIPVMWVRFPPALPVLEEK